MEEKTEAIRLNTGHEERERALDWLTALLPAVVISLIYYRLPALMLEVLAVGGALMAGLLLARPCGHSRQALPLPQAVLTALLAVFCLPSGAPYWAAALIGALAAVFACVPVLMGRVLPGSVFARPLLQPSIAAFLLLRVVLPGVAAGHTLPVQWLGVDTLTAATPLAAFSGRPTAVTAWQLFFGVCSGAIGETCTAALLLGALYLIVRRRVHLVAPAVMLATVSLLSLLVWRSPLYALLAGSTVLTALLLADRQFMPASVGVQAVTGLTAGGLTVLLRAVGPWSEGTSVALLLSQALIPVLPPFWRWLRPHLSRLFAAVGRAVRRFWQFLRGKMQKTEKSEK